MHRYVLSVHRNADKYKQVAPCVCTQLCADLAGGVYVGAYVAYLSMCVAAVVVNSEQKKAHISC